MFDYFWIDFHLSLQQAIAGFQEIDKYIMDWYWSWAGKLIGTSSTIAEACAFVIGLFLSIWWLWAILAFLGVAALLANQLWDCLSEEILDKTPG